MFMTNVSIADEIRRNDKILSLPQALSEILQEVGKDNCSPEKLAKIILKDPSLTGALLKVANSSFYQRYSQISTVQQAINVLGMTTVKCLALSTTVLHPDKIATESGVDTQAFFTYMLSVASASEKLAQAVDYKAPEEASVAGLLNEMGILFFLHHHPAQYRKIISKRIKARSLIEAEKQVFGTDHCEVGALMADTWHLPDYIGKSITNHHSYQLSNDESTLSLVVKLATLITEDRFSGYPLDLEERLTGITEVVEALGISKSKVDEISSNLLQGTISMAEYLGVDIGNVEDMLMLANQEIWKSYLVIENLFKERQELSRKLLHEEREKGAIQSKNVAIATLSHYLNNAAMAIFGRSQLMRMFHDRGNTDKLLEKLPGNLDILDRSVRKIVAVMEEIKEISPIDEVAYHNMSQALNIDDRLEKRMSSVTMDMENSNSVEPAETR